MTSCSGGSTVCRSWRRAGAPRGSVIEATTTCATGTAEREAAVVMVEAIPGQHRITVGGDKAYDTAEFVAAMRGLGATPHVTQNDKARRSAIDGRTTRHPGYQ